MVTKEELLQSLEDNKKSRDQYYDLLDKAEKENNSDLIPYYENIINKTEKEIHDIEQAINSFSDMNSSQNNFSENIENSNTDEPADDNINNMNNPDVPNEKTSKFASTLKGASAWAGKKSLGAVKGTASWGANKASAAYDAGAMPSTDVSNEIKENYVFFFALAVIIIDIYNGFSRAVSGQATISLLLLLSIIIVMLFSIIIKKATLYGILIVVGLWIFSYFSPGINPILSLAVTPRLLMIIGYFLIAIILFVGTKINLSARDSLKAFSLFLGMSLLSFFLPMILLRITQHLSAQIFLILFPPWIMYFVFIHADTEFLQSAKQLYVLAIIAYIIFVPIPGLSQDNSIAMMIASGARQIDPTGLETGARLDRNVVEQFQSQWENQKKVYTGEYLKGDVTEETKIISLIGMEILNPIMQNSRFDPKIEQNIEVYSRINAFPYKTGLDYVPLELSCYGTLTSEIKQTGFIDTRLIPSADVHPKRINERMLGAQDLRCVYIPLSEHLNKTKRHSIIFEATTKDFVTNMQKRDFFIDKEALDAQLRDYAEYNKISLDTRYLEGTIAGIYRITYDNVISRSDRGPIQIAMSTREMPVIGISDSETGYVTLQTAITNIVPSSQNDPQLFGRIDALKSFEITIPNGLVPDNTGCEGWEYIDNKIILTNERATSISQLLFNLKKNEQQRLPSCRLVLSDRNQLLREPNEPNPASFSAKAVYDYTVQKQFNIQEV